MRRLLRVVAPIALAVACGAPEPSPSPTPTATPDPCATTASRYGKAVVESWIPACSLAQDIYNDTSQAVGAPDAAGSGPDHFSGFVSLGFGGHVTLDLGGCISDAPGPDLRVFQAVSSEPVSVYVSLYPDGPYTLVEAEKACGDPYHNIQHSCEFDLASGGVTRARYVRVEDGELFPCPGGTVSEGADLDGVEALGVATAGSNDALTNR
jgi:hypothetical protein